MAATMYVSLLSSKPSMARGKRDSKRDSEQQHCFFLSSLSTKYFIQPKTNRGQEPRQPTTDPKPTLLGEDKSAPPPRPPKSPA